MEEKGLHLGFQDMRRETDEAGKGRERLKREGKKKKRDREKIDTVSCGPWQWRIYTWSRQYSFINSRQKKGGCIN